MDLEIVDNPEVTAVDTPAEECIWRQNEVDDSDTSSGKGTLLENEDGSETVRVHYVSILGILFHLNVILNLGAVFGILINESNNCGGVPLFFN